MTQRENKRLSKIEELYKGKIKNINDLTGGREPSKLFYILARHLDYLLDTDPNVCIKKYGVKFRRALNPIVKKIAPLFMQSKQVIEDRNKLMYPKGPKKRDKKYSSEIELPEEPVIWMANHAFKDDVVATICAAKRHGYLLLGSVPQFYNQFDGVAAYVNGVVLANRKVKSSKKASIDKSVKAMSYGADLIMFPEGVWNKTPHIPIISLWSGIYRIAKKTGAKIVPVVHYTTDMLNKDKESIIHTVIDDPIDISDMTQEEALDYLRDIMATWSYLMMEKYGKSTRKKEIGKHATSQEAWEEHLKERVKTADRYDIEIETNADFRPKEIDDPIEIWEKIANIETIDARSIKTVEYAKKMIKERKNNDFQRRF